MNANILDRLNQEVPFDADELGGKRAIVVQMLKAIGEDPNREGLVETPDRVVRSWAELFGGYSQDPIRILAKTFESPNNAMVICKNIDFHSTCEHHLIPFSGKAHVGYLPNGRVVGLSKLERVVQCFAHRLQIQETMTHQIADAIQQALNPLGVMVVIEAQHLCMKARGVRNHSSEMVTSAILGRFEAAEVRAEFLSLIRGKA